jgi:hypothetical protein
MRLTAKDAKAAGLPVPKRAKYGNRKTTVDGITFHSAREARRYGELKLLEKAGKIEQLELQPRFKLLVNGCPICTYVGDFFYYERGQPVVEDAKGFRTREYKLKKKLLAALRGLEIKEV